MGQTWALDLAQKEGNGNCLSHSSSNGLPSNPDPVESWVKSMLVQSARSRAWEQDTLLGLHVQVQLCENTLNDMIGGSCRASRHLQASGQHLMLPPGQSTQVPAGDEGEEHIEHSTFQEGTALAIALQSLPWIPNLLEQVSSLMTNTSCQFPEPPPPTSSYPTSSTHTPAPALPSPLTKCMGIKEVLGKTACVKTIVLSADGPQHSHPGRPKAHSLQ